MKIDKEFLDNSEWRIKPVHFCDPHAMMKTNWGAVFGALLFIGGIVAGF